MPDFGMKTYTEDYSGSAWKNPPSFLERVGSGNHCHGAGLRLMAQFAISDGTSWWNDRFMDRAVRVASPSDMAVVEAKVRNQLSYSRDGNVKAFIHLWGAVQTAIYLPLPKPDYSGEGILRAEREGILCYLPCLLDIWIKLAIIIA
jgi:hypothetical protein